jgi:hypothetical protein
MEIHVISTTDLLGPDWRFLASFCQDAAWTWETHSGLPQTAPERLIRRPSLARWRAGAAAALAARHRPDTILVSHLPMMGAVTNVMRRSLCPQVPQIAFSFNFTDLPGGLRRSFLRQALRGIEEFVVFSRLEQTLYAEILGLPEERLHFLPWAMEAPIPGPENPLPPELIAGGYFCAIGGEGRDYALMAEAMRARPRMRMVIVGRPYSLAGITFPANVTVFANLPLAKTWRIAADSRGMIIPLRTETTACGHITLIGTQLLGLPLVISASRGVSDYVEDGVTATLVPVGNRAALVEAIDSLYHRPEAMAALATLARSRAETRNALPSWMDYFRDAARRLRP